MQCLHLRQSLCLDQSTPPQLARMLVYKNVKCIHWDHFYDYLLQKVTIEVDFDNK